MDCDFDLIVVGSGGAGLTAGWWRRPAGSTGSPGMTLGLALTGGWLAGSRVAETPQLEPDR